MEGADLGGADLRKTDWAGATFTASPAQSADLRGATNLRQEQLALLIGDETTLLPDESDAGKPFYVWSCWAEPPEGFDELVARGSSSPSDSDEFRREWLCPPGTEPQKTGTPWPLDKPRPDGHPLGQQ